MVNSVHIDSKLIPGQGRVPFPAYRGEDKYIFVSYAHRDNNIVFPEIRRYQSMKYNVWYDEGICPGNEWKKDIERSLKNSDLFIIFMSNRSAASKNVRKEFYCAKENGKNIIPFYIDDFDSIEIDSEWKRDLSEIQGILMTTLSDEEYVFKFTEAFKKFGFEIKSRIPDMFYESSTESKFNSNGVLNDIGPYVDDFFSQLTLFDDTREHSDFKGKKYMHNYKRILKAAIDVFLQHPSRYSAFQIYETFFEIYQVRPEDKSELIEKTSSTTEPNIILDLLNVIRNNDDESLRDNFIHGVNVFLLGLAIYARNEKYREYFKQYILDEYKYKKYFKTSDGEMSDEEFLYRWAITSLFHDIAHFIEISDFSSMKSLYKQFSSILLTDGSFEDFKDFNSIVMIPPYNFGEDYRRTDYISRIINLFVPLDIMAHKIRIDFNFDSKQFKKILKILNHMYSSLIDENDFVEHGFISSILLLNAYGYLFQKYATLNYGYFFYPIVDSATAILLHSFYGEMMYGRGMFFNEQLYLEDMRCYRSPIAYLLSLCDHLLEISADNIYFSIDDDVLIFRYGDSSLYYADNLDFKEKELYNILNVDEIIFDELDFKQKQLKRILNVNELFAERISLKLIRNIGKVRYEEFFKFEKFEMPYYQNELSNNISELAKEISNNPKMMDLEMRKNNFEMPEARYVNKSEYVSKALSYMGYEVIDSSDSGDDRQAIKSFNQVEVMKLAEIMHIGWCEEKIYLGWKKGLKINVEDHISPYLVSWNELDDEIKQIDVEFVENIPSLVESIGLKIVFSRLALLTFKIFEMGDSRGSGFDSLSEHSQNHFYQKTKLLVKLLNENRIELIPSDELDEDIFEFDYNQIRSFSIELHRRWCSYMYANGWKYGPIFDEDIKTVPYLVSWDELDGKYRDFEYWHVIANLGKLCREAGLKIVEI